MGKRRLYQRAAKVAKVKLPERLKYVGIPDEPPQDVTTKVAPLRSAEAVVKRAAKVAPAKEAPKAAPKKAAKKAARKRR
jgi:uncharacterized membrane protein YdbT with pleckstrin-like domain